MLYAIHTLWKSVVCLLASHYDWPYILHIYIYIYTILYTKIILSSYETIGLVLGSDSSHLITSLPFIFFYLDSSVALISTSCNHPWPCSLIRNDNLTPISCLFLNLLFLGEFYLHWPFCLYEEFNWMMSVSH